MPREYQRHWPAAASLAAYVLFLNASAMCDAASNRQPFDRPIVVCQLPVANAPSGACQATNGTLRMAFGDGARLVLVSPDGTVRVLSRDFHSAVDPSISFDGKRMLFSAKRLTSDEWNVFEMDLASHAVRQVTKDMRNCRTPCYQSTLYTIVSTEPWYQITFVSDLADAENEAASVPATDLYSCKLDGSSVRRLTYNLSSDIDPIMMEDGRLLFSSWQRSGLKYGKLGRVGLFGINIDGADYAAFCVEGGLRVKHMPCVTTKGLAVFVESESVPWDGSGRLGCVTLRRPMHSYRSLTKVTDGLFAFPSALADGRVLVSMRPADGSGTHDVFCYDPSSNGSRPVFADPKFHNLQAKLIRAVSEPDGRSSVVTEKDKNGKFYCLNVYTTDLEISDWLPAGTVKRLRVLEGLPTQLAAGGAADKVRAADCADNANAVASKETPRLAGRRFLGEIPVADDGSFNIQIPANTPIELQILDADGFAMRSCSWIWAKNHEPRGCIGCHEDGELTPENQFVNAVSRSSVSLCLPESRRRSIDFRRDVLPIISAKCTSCHAKDGAAPRLETPDGDTESPTATVAAKTVYCTLLKPSANPSDPVAFGSFVHPGRARTSPLIWHIFGRNTSRPWDKPWCSKTIKLIPAAEATPLTDDERRTFVEWIDLGAQFADRPRTEH